MESGSLDVSEQVGIASHVVKKSEKGIANMAAIWLNFVKKSTYDIPQKRTTKSSNSSPFDLSALFYLFVSASIFALP